MISRFFFNITIFENLKNIISVPFFKTRDFDYEINEALQIFYKNPSAYYFDYGRTAFYEILCEVKKKTTKRKILVNSLTLFEIINVIIYSGFIPVFVDNKHNSLETQIDLKSIEFDLNEIAAIVITHLNGANKNILQVKTQVDTHNLNKDKIFLIEDCAVAFGSKIDNKYVGSFGHFSFFSFNIMKNITSYTGGLLLDNYKQIKFDHSKYKQLTKLLVLKKALFVFMLQLLNTKILFPFFFQLIKFSHKQSFNFFLKKYRTDFEVIIQNKFPDKFRYLMHNLQKKILFKQFKNVDAKQIGRIDKSNIYHDGLKTIKDLYFPQTDFSKKSIFIDFPIICTSKSIKEKLFLYLLDKGIDVKNYYYKNCSEEEVYKPNNLTCLNSKSLSECILMLPVHEDIKLKYQKKIITSINNFYNRF